MAFELKQGEAIPNGVRRIVCKRIDEALETIDGTKRQVSDRAIHNVRKRFKEIRGTLRLVRDELGEKVFARENRAYRDAGRPLSSVRDAKVLIDALNGLLKHFKGRVHPRNLARLRRLLEARRRATRQQVLQEGRAVSGIVRSILAAKNRVDGWPLQRPGWKAIEGGLARVYAQGRSAMKTALDDPSDEPLHEWRKRAKDLRYELELLVPIWPESMKPLAEQARKLTDLLGEDHDLAVLRTVVRDETGNEASVDDELLFALIDERRVALQSEAEQLGRKLYEEPQKKFVKRLKGYWKASLQASAGVQPRLPVPAASTSARQNI